MEDSEYRSALIARIMDSIKPNKENQTRDDLFSLESDSQVIADAKISELLMEL